MAKPIKLTSTHPNMQTSDTFPLYLNFAKKRKENVINLPLKMKT